MTDYGQYTIETAPDGAKPLLENAQKNFGFIPNLLATMAEAPAMLEAYMTLAGIFGKSELDATEEQVVLMTNNYLNGCGYCMAAHTTISQGAGVPQDVLDSLRDNTPLANAKLEALRTFTKVVWETRGHPSQADIDALLAVGYTKGTVLEVIVGTSLKVLSNYTNHVANTPIDAAFQTNSWAIAAE